MDNKTKIVCPTCGTEFAIPETTHVSVGLVIESDSNLGIIHPEIAACYGSKCNIRKPIKDMKSEAKIEALRNAGVNVDNLFSMKGITGDDTLVRIENGVVTVVADDDPIFAAIMGSGTINNPRLFRRWVMAQVYHMLATGDFVRALQSKGYQYQWKMLVEELRVQAKLFDRDPENYKERNRFFNKERVVSIAEDYMKKLRKHLEETPTKSCKGMRYVRLKGRNIFVDDISVKVTCPLRECIYRIQASENPWQLYQATMRFYKAIRKVWLSYNTMMAAAFKDSYKGAGAFFTMKNMVLFHGCKFRNDKGRFMSQKDSLNRLYEYAEEYSNEGWRLFGVMKKLIVDNGIDIEKKMAEWRRE